MQVTFEHGLLVTENFIANLRTMRTVQLCKKLTTAEKPMYCIKFDGVECIQFDSLAHDSAVQMMTDILKHMKEPRCLV